METHSQVLVTGSFSVGKTTLALALARRLGHALLDEPIRELEPLGYPAAFYLTEAMRTYLTHRQILLEALARSAPTIIDAGLPSVLAYNRLAGFNVDPTALGIQTMRYTAVLLLPPGELGIEPDGFRFVDRDLQLQTHSILIDILTEQGLKYRTLNGTLDERLTQAAHLILGTEGTP